MAQETQREYAPDEINEDGEFIKVGGSPVPGITLRQILSGNEEIFRRLAWSPDGCKLASITGSLVIIWDYESGKLQRVLDRRPYTCDHIIDLAWTPDGRILASAGNECLYFWDVENGKLLLELGGRNGCLAWSPNGLLLAAGAYNGVVIWDVKKEIQVHQIENRIDRKYSSSDLFSNIAWSPDGQFLAVVVNLAFRQI
jgi:WD40 repeat protein